MKTRIISAFPGMGKSFVSSMNIETCLDSDSSNFSWLKKPDLSGDGVGTNSDVRNPEFPANYIAHIKENIGKYEFIFVSSHEVVRKALIQECIFFYLVYPVVWMKDVFIERYVKRKSPQSFIDLISKNWDNWINELIIFENNNAGHSNWYTDKIYFSEILNDIIISENDVIKTKFYIN